MEGNSIKNYLETLIENIPTAWLDLTTHRLDIYNESLAKAEFLEQFEVYLTQKTQRQKHFKNYQQLMIIFGWDILCLVFWNGVLPN